MGIKTKPIAAAITTTKQTPTTNIQPIKKPIPIKPMPEKKKP
jgi:hypothetical protein